MSGTFPKEWTVRRDGSHYNAAPEWHGYGGRCDQEPRLSYIDRYYRNGSAQRDWQVDGMPCATMAEAWERLQTPPTFSAEELSVLSTLTDVPTDLRKVHPYEVLRALRDKGAASAKMGRFAITDAGRVALTPRPLKEEQGHG